MSELQQELRDLQGLHGLIDEMAIRRLYDREFYMYDNGLRAKVPEEVFTADATIYLGPEGGFELPDQIEDYRGYLLKNDECGDPIVHNRGQLYLEINGDTALGVKTHVTYAWGKIPGDQGGTWIRRPADVISWAQHTDRLVRTPAGWKIARRETRIHGWGDFRPL
jgi:hypothetical protein